MQILTWNIRWGCGCDERVDFDRIADVITGAATPPPEVLCLQEVAINHAGLTGSRGENQVEELLVRLPGYSAHYAIGSDLPDESGGRRLFGNLILSRRPVLQVFRHALPWPADPAFASMPRVAIEAVVEAPDGPLRVVTTHLEYYSLRQRRAQLRGLRRLLDEGGGHAAALRPDSDTDPPFRTLPRPRAAVCCGDFNCPPEAAELGELLTDSGYVDAWPLAHPGAAHAHTVGLHGCDWPDHPYCCDYFVVSRDLAPRVAALEVLQDTSASDHQPLLLRLA